MNKLNVEESNSVQGLERVTVTITKSCCCHRCGTQVQMDKRWTWRISSYLYLKRYYRDSLLCKKCYTALNIIHQIFLSDGVQILPPSEYRGIK